MDVTPELLQESYAQLNEVLGTEQMMKVFEIYRGRQISFPMRLYDRKKVAKKIIAEYNGHNLVQLTHKYDYSQRWIRQIIRQNGSKTE
ncbi:Mor transcription activator family protein [Furfurilactobacillus milii]|uniref:Mor transcription activator family protein n=2 Tax=Furfurilactobacillus TaxID=2767882 RepID=A0ABT6DC63_9LACO|nr:Mor transcription activator family protein [Furfurilactobacillus milii]QLE65629.1 hypothetical protein LROSL2_0276 [Furfurilactobacillus rossiae]MCF6161797.1 Mor transcription activator family protein [Furfurilactobacillus milii]MCF6164191.1 Mor transcription activator family protein [Furfurilactobacillus milii]MDF9914734.1 Mor transcription activator family protein [Furfurilactobacillus milii]MYV06228.1 Mor transcription activator family protein [Furfurilactobacillus milii]